MIYITLIVVCCVIDCTLEIFKDELGGEEVGNEGRKEDALHSSVLHNIPKELRKMTEGLLPKLSPPLAALVSCLTQSNDRAGLGSDIAHLSSANL